MGVFFYSNRLVETASIENVLYSRGHKDIRVEKTSSSTLVFAGKVLTPNVNFIGGKDLGGADEDFIVGVGTFFYDGATGIEALRRVYDNIESVINDNPVYGHWAFCVRKGASTYILNDMSGMMRLYYHYDGDSITVSTSMLSVIATIEHPIFDKVRLAGFIMSRYASSIPFVEGVELLRPTHYVLINKDSKIVWKKRSQPKVPVINETSMAVDHVSRLFDEQVGQLAILKNEQVGVELSAGLDSRLIASVIKSGGFKFNFVHYPLYGPDKEIAYLVADGIGKEIHLQDDKTKLTPKEFSENYGEFDFSLNFFNHHASKRQMIKNTIQFTGGYGEVIDLPEFYSDEDESTRYNPEIKFLLRELTLRTREKIVKKEFQQKWMEYIVDYFIQEGIPSGRNMTEREQMDFYHILVPHLILSNTISAYNACTQRYGMYEEYHFTHQVDGISFRAKEGRKLTLALIKIKDKELASYPFISRLITRRESVADTNELPVQYKHYGNLKRRLPDWFIDFWYRRQGMVFDKKLLMDIDFSVYEKVLNTNVIRKRLGLYKVNLERLYSIEVLRKVMGISM